MFVGEAFGCQPASRSRWPALPSALLMTTIGVTLQRHGLRRKVLESNQSWCSMDATCGTRPIAVNMVHGRRCGHMHAHALISLSPQYLVSSLRPLHKNGGSSTLLGLVCVLGYVCSDDECCLMRLQSKAPTGTLSATSTVGTTSTLPLTGTTYGTLTKSSGKSGVLAVHSGVPCILGVTCILISFI